MLQMNYLFIAIILLNIVFVMMEEMQGSPFNKGTSEIFINNRIGNEMKNIEDIGVENVINSYPKFQNWNANMLNPNNGIVSAKSKSKYQKIRNFANNDLRDNGKYFGDALEIKQVNNSITSGNLQRQISGNHHLHRNKQNHNYGKYRHRKHVNLDNIRSTFGDYDDGQALLDLLHSNEKKELPNNFKVIYNNDFDPVIIYNGPTEKHIYYNTKKKRDLKNKELFSDYDYEEEEVVNSNDINSRFGGYLKAVTDGKLYVNSTFIPYKTEYNRFKWKGNTSIPKDIQEIALKNFRKFQNEQRPLNQGTLKINPNINEKKTITVHTTESLLIKTQYSTRTSFHSNLSISLPKVSEELSMQKKLNLMNEPSSNKECPNSNQKTVAICHPSGGQPKFLKDQTNPDFRDKQYNEILTGELTEKVVQKILDKAIKNEKMKNEFGLCCKNMTIEMRQHYINVTNTGTCCTSLYGELKCFLNWLLISELTRKSRSHYYNIKPDRNFLFDHIYLNPWSENHKKDTIALPPSLYGFSQQPIYGFGKDGYTSKLFYDSPQPDEELEDRLIYRSKIVYFPENED